MKWETVGLIGFGIFSGLFICTVLTNLLWRTPNPISVIVVMGAILFLFGFTVGWKGENVGYLGIGFFIGFLISTALISPILTIGIATFLVGYSASGILTEKRKNNES